MVQQIAQSNGHNPSISDITNLENSLIVKPIAFIINPSDDASIFAGEIFELRVTVINQGNIGAVINVYIDETSGLLRNWCSYPYESLALANNCVELLPAPGTVALEGSIFYPITQQPGLEIITLTVRGELGEQLNRSVAIEKIVLPISESLKTKDKRLDSSPSVSKNLRKVVR